MSPWLLLSCARIVEGVGVGDSTPPVMISVHNQAQRATINVGSWRVDVVVHYNLCPRGRCAEAGDDPSHRDVRECPRNSIGVPYHSVTSPSKQGGGGGGPAGWPASCCTFGAAVHTRHHEPLVAHVHALRTIVLLGWRRQRVQARGLKRDALRHQHQSATIQNLSSASTLHVPLESSCTCWRQLTSVPGENEKGESSGSSSSRACRVSSRCL